MLISRNLISFSSCQSVVTSRNKGKTHINTLQIFPYCQNIEALIADLSDKERGCPTFQNLNMTPVTSDSFSMDASKASHACQWRLSEKKMALWSILRVKALIATSHVKIIYKAGLLELMHFRMKIKQGFISYVKNTPRFGIKFVDECCFPKILEMRIKTSLCGSWTAW